jgi:hypothetical protein
VRHSKVRGRTRSEEERKETRSGRIGQQSGQKDTGAQQDLATALRNRIGEGRSNRQRAEKHDERDADQVAVKQPVGKAGDGNDNHHASRVEADGRGLVAFRVRGYSGHRVE